MQFNSILFPAPENCYQYRRIENIVYIPNIPIKPNATGKQNKGNKEEEKTATAPKNDKTTVQGI